MGNILTNSVKLPATFLVDMVQVHLLITSFWCLRKRMFVTY
ncbi:hypothetical protein BDD30_3472 [Photorhabdus asymbiotica]|uniref:Transposase n=1 Tax=Photorhabdus asymbiotica TaxID=291112 RepID=A0ABX9SIA4_9GAMM|nr:hypothetical protein BDD30_3472 [Photorhabdus asymbiotica]